MGPPRYLIFLITNGNLWLTRLFKKPSPLGSSNMVLYELSRRPDSCFCLPLAPAKDRKVPAKGQSLAFPSCKGKDPRRHSAMRGAPWSLSQEKLHSGCPGCFPGTVSWLATQDLKFEGVYLSYVSATFRLRSCGLKSLRLNHL